MVIICDHGVFAKVVTTKHWMTIWLTMINHQQILKYPILVYIQTHQRTWNLGKHEVEPFHGMEHNFLSSRRSRRNSKGVAQVEPTNGLKKQIAPDSDLTDLRVLTQRVQDQRTRYQGCCGLASTNQGGLPYIPPKVETTYAFRSAKDEGHHEHSKKSKQQTKIRGWVKTNGE